MFMNSFLEKILISLRYRLSLFNRKQLGGGNLITSNPKECNRLILEALQSGGPFMVARFGSTEMHLIANYLNVKNNPHSYLNYILGKQEQWWWSRTKVENIKALSGFFPLTEECIEKFCLLTIEDAKYIDILGSWVDDESYIEKELKNAKKFALGDLKPPYRDSFSECNWLQGLAGKCVLVIHPFADTINNQYNCNRTKLFPNPNFLPLFTLVTIKAVQSLGGTCDFRTWFEALDWMKSEMDKVEYDVCILGCGAYGLPLAAHAKRTGHVAIHIGGGAQMLFGIRGRRWDDDEFFKPLYNEYWTRPSEKETPKTAQQVEGGCYW